MVKKLIKTAKDLVELLFWCEATSVFISSYGQFACIALIYPDCVLASNLEVGEFLEIINSYVKSIWQYNLIDDFRYSDYFPESVSWFFQKFQIQM